MGTELVAVAEKTVTTKELAEMLGVDIKTIQRTARAIFEPSTLLSRVINGGNSLVFTEAQATAIKIELQNHSKVARSGFDTLTISNDIEMYAIQKKLLAYQDMRIEQLLSENKAYKNCLDDMTSAKGFYALRNAAKILNIKPQEFNRQLIAIDFCMNNREHEIKQNMIDRGYGVFIIPKTPSADGVCHGSTKISAKGIVYIAKKLKVEPDEKLMSELQEQE